MPTMKHEMTFFYTNRRGEYALRRVQPILFWYGTSEHRQAEGDQWYLEAFCHDRQATRKFALAHMDFKDIEYTLSDA